MVENVLKRHEAVFAAKHQKVKYKIREFVDNDTIGIAIIISVNGMDYAPFYSTSGTAEYTTLDKMWEKFVEDLLFYHGMDSVFEKWKAIYDSQQKQSV